MEVLRENYVGNFIEDVVSALKNETFDQIVWVGFHEWTQYAAKAIWQMGWKLEMTVTNSDSRWGQKICGDGGHELTVVPFEKAEKTGNSAIYMIAAKRGDEMINQLMSFGIERSRILVFDSPKKYLDKANWKVREKYLHGLRKLSHEESQKELYELMKVFRDFCEKNNLRYFMSAGTLLGAVRHQGFIPWDNDVDFWMPVKDYLRLEEVFPEEGVGGYKLLTRKNCPLILGGAPKLVNDRIKSLLLEDARITPIGIDIILIGCFPEKVSDYCRERNRWMDFWEKLKESYYLKNLSIEEYQKELSERYIAWSQVSSSLVGETYGNTLTSCEYFSASVKLPFLDGEFDAPAGWQEVLRDIYGNYERLPAFADRKGFAIENYADI